MDTRTTIWHNILNPSLPNLLCLTLATALLPHTASAQTAPIQPDDLKTSITNIQAGSFSNADVEIVARAKATQQALPALEQQFEATADAHTRAITAEALVRLGDKNNTYWNFLLQQATLAVDSDLPYPFYDSQGKATGRQLSPDFKAWIQAHQVDASTAVISALYDLPGKVLLLGETGDPRGIPLLRRALRAHNYLIVVFASKGLARIQDKQSILLIITAIQGAPTEYGSLIAESLLYFDDVLAQSAVDSYMPKDTATIARDEKARGRGVFGW